MWAWGSTAGTFILPSSLNIYSGIPSSDADLRSSQLPSINSAWHSLLKPACSALIWISMSKEAGAEERQLSDSAGIKGKKMDALFILKKMNNGYLMIKRSSHHQWGTDYKQTRSLYCFSYRTETTEKKDGWKDLQHSCNYSSNYYFRELAYIYIYIYNFAGLNIYNYGLFTWNIFLEACQNWLNFPENLCILLKIWNTAVTTLSPNIIVVQMVWISL